MGWLGGGVAASTGAQPRPRTPGGTVPGSAAVTRCQQESRPKRRDTKGAAATPLLAPPPVRPQPAPQPPRPEPPPRPQPQLRSPPPPPQPTVELEAPLAPTQLPSHPQLAPPPARPPPPPPPKPQLRSRPAPPQPTVRPQPVPPPAPPQAQLAAAPAILHPAPQPQLEAPPAPPQPLSQPQLAPPPARPQPPPQPQLRSPAAPPPPQLAPPPARPQLHPHPQPQPQQRRELVQPAERPAPAAEDALQADDAGGAGPASGPDKYVRFWLRQLASELADLLRNVAPDGPIDPALAAAVLKIMPAPAPEQQEDAPAQSTPHVSASAGRAGAAGDKAAVGPDKFTLQLAATLRAHCDAADAAGPRGGGEAGRRPAGSTLDPASPDQPQGQVISPAALMLLFKLVTDVGGIRASEALHCILDASPVERYPVDHPRMLLQMASLLAANGREASARRALLRVPAIPGAATRRQWLGTLSAMADTGRAELVQAVVARMCDCGLGSPNDSIEAVMYARRLAGDAAAVREEFRSAAARGLKPTHAMHAMLAAAEAEGGNVERALVMVQEAEEFLGHEPRKVYKALLAVCVGPRAPQGLRAPLLERMQHKGVLLSCRHITNLLVQAERCAGVAALVDLLGELRAASLVVGLGARREAPDEEPGAVEEGDATDGDDEAFGAAAGLQSDTELGSDSEEGPASEAERAGDAGSDGGDDDAGADAPVPRLYIRLVMAAHRARLPRDVRRLCAWMAADGVRRPRAVVSRLAATLAHCAGDEGVADQAFELYSQLHRDSEAMDSFFYNHLIAAQLQGAEARERWPRVLQLFHALHIGLPNCDDTHTQTTAISAAGRAGWLPEMMALYNLMLQDGILPRSITWRALILASMRCGAPSLGLRFMEAMQSMGAPLDPATAAAALGCCGALRDVAAAERVWASLAAAGVRPDGSAHNAFMQACLAAGSPAKAVTAFDAWEQRRGRGGPRSGGGDGSGSDDGEEETFGSVVAGLARSGHWRQSREALYLQRWMREQGVDPGALTLREAAERAKRPGAEPQWHQAASLGAGVLAQRGAAAAPDITAFAAAVLALVQLGQHARAAELACRMPSLDIQPNLQEYNIALDACSAAGQLRPALALLRRLKAAGLAPNRYSYSSLLSACAAEARVDVARGVFRSMLADGHVPNLVNVNCMLKVCAAAADADAAAEVFARLGPDFGLLPDEITYASAVEAFGRAGRWAEALKVLAAAQAAGGLPRGSAAWLSGAPPPPLILDLHYLSVVGAAAMLRGWLCLLRRQLANGRLVACDHSATHFAPRRTFAVVTGRGRHAADGVSRLRPPIQQLLTGGLGAQAEIFEPPDNPGVLYIRDEAMARFLAAPGLKLSLGPASEEEALCQALAAAAAAAMAERAKLAPPTGDEATSKADREKN